MDPSWKLKRNLTSIAVSIGWMYICTLDLLMQILFLYYLSLLFIRLQILDYIQHRMTELTASAVSEGHLLMDWLH
jgi:hypothetical protein